jgi:hypothetical protein
MTDRTSLAEEGARAFRDHGITTAIPAMHIPTGTSSAGRATQSAVSDWPRNRVPITVVAVRLCLLAVARSCYRMTPGSEMSVETLLG